MKNVLIGLLMVQSLSSFAGQLHVGDSDLFLNIGKIEKITLLKTLNIKPNTDQTALGSRCFLVHNISGVDRSLTAGKEFKFESVYSLDYRALDVYYTEKYDHLGIEFRGMKSASQITCKFNDAEKVTVGQVKEALKDYIKLTLAAPVEME
jgi:hypothetical protein